MVFQLLLHHCHSHVAAVAAALVQLAVRDLCAGKIASVLRRSVGVALGSAVDGLARERPRIKVLEGVKLRRVSAKSSQSYICLTYIDTHVRPEGLPSASHK